MEEQIRSAVNGNKPLADKARKLGEEAQESVYGMKDQARKLYETAGEFASEAKKELAEKGRGLYESACESGKSSLCKLEERVKANPTTSLAIAAGVGLLFGLCTRRRSM